MSETSAPVTDGAKSGPVKQPLKRPLFNKPSWSKPQATVDTSDLFHRSNTTYVSVAAEEAARRKKKAAKHYQEPIRDGPSTRPEKRRRLSDDSDNDDEQENSNENPKSTRIESTKSTAKDEVGEVPKSISLAQDPPPPKSLSKSYEESIALRKVEQERSMPSYVIDLEDEDGDDKEAEAGSEDDKVEITAVSRQPLPQYDDFAASDEEFPELARMAREKARRKRLEADPVPALSTDLQSREIPDGSQDLSQPLQKSHQTAIDPIVSLLITSRIPNTAPLVVNRRLGQRLKDVRLVWCQRQQFSPEATQDIVLTFRDKQVYDVSSCKSLGIGVNADGNVVMPGEKDVFGEENRKIQMEAMTREMLKELKKAKERPVKEKTAEAEAEAQEILSEQPMKESQIRIILKAKDYEDFKLLVKPSTRISRMVSAFRLTNQIGPEKLVNLLFDGEQLDPLTAIGSTELSDMDNIDVYIR